MMDVHHIKTPTDTSRALNIRVTRSGILVFEVKRHRAAPAIRWCERRRQALSVGAVTAHAGRPPVGHYRGRGIICRVGVGTSIRARIASVGVSGGYQNLSCGDKITSRKRDARPHANHRAVCRCHQIDGSSSYAITGGGSCHAIRGLNIWLRVLLARLRSAGRGRKPAGKQ